MNWSLIAAGVTAGLGVVIAKQWFDKRLKDEEREFIDRGDTVESASANSARAHHEEPSEPAEATPQPEIDASNEPSTGASTQGGSDGERVEEALASGDLSTIETVLQETEDPIDRNRLLNRLVAGHYRSRSGPEHREAFYRMAHTQIDEASAILNAIEETGTPRPDHIEAFKSIAIALEEDKHYDEAIAVCEKAMSLGLEDGTKTGFKGRIARLRKQRDAA